MIVWNIQDLLKLMTLVIIVDTKSLTLTPDSFMDFYTGCEVIPSSFFLMFTFSFWNQIWPINVCFTSSIKIYLTDVWMVLRGDLNWKIPKISASDRNFLDSLPPLWKRALTNKNAGISYLIVIIKFGFFETSNPPPYFTRKPNLTDSYNWGGPLIFLVFFLTCKPNY